jgi:hypothetical protein
MQIQLTVFLNSLEDSTTQFVWPWISAILAPMLNEKGNWTISVPKSIHCVSKTNANRPTTIQMSAKIEIWLAEQTKKKSWPEYNLQRPLSLLWSLEEPLHSPQNSACAVCWSGVIVARFGFHTHYYTHTDSFPTITEIVSQLLSAHEPLSAVTKEAHSRGSDEDLLGLGQFLELFWIWISFGRTKNLNHLHSK